MFLRRRGSLNEAPFSVLKLERTLIKHLYINRKGNSTFHMIVMLSENMKEGDRVPQKHCAFHPYYAEHKGLSEMMWQRLTIDNQAST